MSTYTEEQNQMWRDVEGIQSFDPLSLIKAEHGALKLDNVVPSVQRIVDFYKLIDKSVIPLLPLSALEAVRNSASKDMALIVKAKDYDIERTGNPSAVRVKLKDDFEARWTGLFSELNNVVSYSIVTSANFKKLEEDTRKMRGEIQEQAREIIDDLSNIRKEAQEIVVDIRAVALETGVSQKAIYFQEASNAYADESRKWQWHIYGWFAALAGYVLLTFVLHRIPFLVPDNNYMLVQLIASKVMMFALLSFMLYQSSKNFLACRHNVVINKHRHNALVSYKAIVDASGDTASTDIILGQVATCIFSVQQSGYTGNSSSDGAVAKSAVELIGGKLMQP